MVAVSVDAPVTRDILSLTNSLHIIKATKTNLDVVDNRLKYSLIHFDLVEDVSRIYSLTISGRKKKALVQACIYPLGQTPGTTSSQWQEKSSLGVGVGDQVLVWLACWTRLLGLQEVLCCGICMLRFFFFFFLLWLEGCREMVLSGELWGGGK